MRMNAHAESWSQSNDKFHVQWKAAGLAGFLVGLIFLLVNHGIPWASSGLVEPAIMGRDVKSSGEGGVAYGLQVAFAHLTLAVAYADIIAPAVYRFTTIPAIVCGGVIGLILYFVTYPIFNAVAAQSEMREWISMGTHVAFGMGAAGAYKGLAKKPLAGSRQAG